MNLYQAALFVHTIYDVPTGGEVFRLARVLCKIKVLASASVSGG